MKVLIIKVPSEFCCYSCAFLIILSYILRQVLRLVELYMQFAWSKEKFFKLTVNAFKVNGNLTGLPVIESSKHVTKFKV